jgi:hypothetical protein
LKLRADSGARPKYLWPPWAWAASRSSRWRLALKLLPLARPVASGWTGSRDWPEPSRVDFRRWWRDRA